MITETRTKRPAGMPHATRFGRYPKTTLFVFNLTIFVILILLIEFCLGAIMGLGNPVIYDSSPLYGFRPLPNQEIKRFGGAIIKTNNLGLRANEDWDKNADNKILFLGDSITYGGSRISNDELFSNLVAQNLAGYQSANAGVNAWGVENIHGLIVSSNFMPAKIYVTTLIENDFYRGLNRIKGKNYWNRKPNFAMEELFHYFLSRTSTKKYRSWLEFATDDHRRAVLTQAVSKLKEMDEVLKACGYVHLIYISPTKEQVLHNASKISTAKAKLIRQLLEQAELRVTYLLGEIDALNLNDKEKASLFYDNMHLQRKGHQVWAKIINKDLKNVIKTL